MPRSRRAGLLAALASLVALSCGSDTIDLLPLTGGGAAGRANEGGFSNAGSDASGGSEVSGGGKAGASGSGGAPAGATAGGGGKSGMSGQGGRGDGCYGPGCGGGVSLGGSFSFPCEATGMTTCQSCMEDSQCPTNQHCSHNICAECWTDGDCDNAVCDKLVHRCAPICQNTLECRDGRVCDPAYGACVPCTQNGDGCPVEAHICSFRRCVQCLVDGNCVGSKKYCFLNQCVECLNDRDCGDPALRCDRSGHCQQR